MDRREAAQNPLTKCQALSLIVTILWCLPFQDIISEEASKDRSLALTGMPTARVSVCGHNHLLRSFPFRQTASPFTLQDGGNYEHVPGVSGALEESCSCLAECTFESSENYTWFLSGY